MQRTRQKRFANHTADQCYQCYVACVYLFLFPREAINAETEQSDHHQKEEKKLQCSLVNCLRWSAVKTFRVAKYGKGQPHIIGLDRSPFLLYYIDVSEFWFLPGYPTNVQMTSLSWIGWITMEIEVIEVQGMNGK